MTFLNEEQKQRLRAQIEEVEKQTSGELVTVIARQSDPYPYVPLLWASVIALSLLPLMGLAGLRFELTTVSIIQLGGFLVLSTLFRWPPLKMRLIPKQTKLRRAARSAREQFLEQGLHHTRDRSGVLIYVSVGERYVEILADKGINEKVDQSQWDGIVADFIQAVKKGRTAEGFEQAVAACGAVLAEHFPAAPGDKNELPDHLVEL